MHDESSWKEGVKATADDKAMAVTKEENGELAKAAETGPSVMHATSGAGNRIDLGQVT